jgi:F0F1-type ATP synthase assembly protein I
MTQTGKPPEKDRVNYTAMSTQALTIGGEVGCLTLVIVLVSVFGGLWLDNLLGTKPLFTLILVLGSAPIALGLTFWVAKRQLQNVQSSTLKSEEINSMKGDQTGE